MTPLVRERDRVKKPLLFVTKPLYKSLNPKPLSRASQAVVNLSKCANTRGRETGLAFGKSN